MLSFQVLSGVINYTNKHIMFRKEFKNMYTKGIYCILRLEYEYN